jgi:hypothetical protein
MSTTPDTPLTPATPSTSAATSTPGENQAPMQPRPVIYGPMRYNPSLSLKKPTFKKLDSLRFGFCRHTGMFRAVTDSYYATPA